ncbi:MAG TPA: TraR/DksA C4-type zinc finger protein [Azospirillum sp.]|nr:TraR/DksA C4-type zinc finger protein [Azospirillum sp.]
MADDADNAQAATDRFLSHALAGRITGPRPGPGSDACVRCGEPIPAARRHAVDGVATCVSCQDELERARRRVA